jgi:hypothetical protein
VSEDEDEDEDEDGYGKQRLGTLPLGALSGRL